MRQFDEESDHAAFYTASGFADGKRSFAALRHQNGATIARYLDYGLLGVFLFLSSVLSPSGAKTKTSLLLPFAFSQRHGQYGATTKSEVQVAASEVPLHLACSFESDLHRVKSCGWPLWLRTARITVLAMRSRATESSTPGLGLGGLLRVVERHTDLRCRDNAIGSVTLSRCSIPLYR